MTELIIENISKSYVKSQKALDNVSLHIKPGTLISLLGPSGCGKTTLLRIIAGLEQLDSGKLICNGEDFSHIPVQKRNIGMVFQHYALFPNLTVEKNVMYGLEMHGVPKDEARTRANEWLSRVKLSAKKDNYPHELSGGQQQRVALARALVMNPQLLLLDEPLSALDAAVRTDLRNEIRQLQLELGITALYVTHDQEEALAMSDEIAVFKDGHLIEMATPEELYNTPQKAFTAEFVGSTNKFAVRVCEVEPLTVILEDQYKLKLPCPANTLLPGEELDLFIRAEHTSLVSANKADCIPGKYMLHNFLGNEVQYKIRLDNGDVVLISTGIEEFVPLPLDSPVGVRIHPAHCHLYNCQGDRIT